jgi:hypothetical protein
MTTPDPRDAFAAALREMQIAHEALMAEVTDVTLAKYGDSCTAARRAFDRMVQAGYERVRQADEGRR